MQTLPNTTDLLSARGYLDRALAILDGTAELVIAAKVADCIDLLHARLGASGS